MLLNWNKFSLLLILFEYMILVFSRFLIGKVAHIEEEYTEVTEDEDGGKDGNLNDKSGEFSN